DPWRNRLRELFRRRDKEAIRDVAAGKEARVQPPATALLLAVLLRRTGETPRAVEVLWSPPVGDLPSLSLGDVTVAEGNAGTTNAVFTVTLSAPSTVPVTVSYATADGTAKASDSDYVATSGTLTFAPGETCKTITVQVKGDKKKEVDEA